MQKSLKKRKKDTSNIHIEDRSLISSTNVCSLGVPLHPRTSKTTFIKIPGETEIE